MKSVLFRHCILGIFGILLAAALAAQDLPVTLSSQGAVVEIISPKDGETVSIRFTVIFGLIGMDVVPAGVDKANGGHHHLLVDQEVLPAAGVAMGSTPIHFGGGQTQTELTLEPGKHTLQLILGDRLHIPHDPPVVSKLITINVE
jgi:hypothetical protein